MGNATSETTTYARMRYAWHMRIKRGRGDDFEPHRKAIQWGMERLLDRACPGSVCGKVRWSVLREMTLEMPFFYSPWDVLRVEVNMYESPDPAHADALRTLVDSDRGQMVNILDKELTRLS